MKIWHRPAITVTSEGREKSDRNERTCKNIFHDREVMRDARHACVATCLDSTQTLDMYVTHEPCTSASDAYTHAYPARAARVPGDLPETRHHAARCAAVGDATHRADCLVLYLVPWRSVCGGQGTTVHKPDQSPARPCAAPLPMMMRPPRSRG